MEEAVGKGGRSLISARKEKGGPTSDVVGLPLLRAREGAAETNKGLDANAGSQATPPRGKHAGARLPDGGGFLGGEPTGGHD